MLLFLKILVGLSVVILIVGLVKPNWICFWMKEPNRIAVSTIAILLFMGAWTAYAKMTMKPREHVPEKHRSVEDQNELQLDNR